MAKNNLLTYLLTYILYFIIDKKLYKGSTKKSYRIVSSCLKEREK